MISLRYTLEVHIPDDPDGVVVKLSQDGRAVDRYTGALIPALDYVIDTLKMKVQIAIDGEDAQ